MAQAQKIVIDELLCFVSNKIDSVPASAIVQLCVSTYSPSQIEESKNVLFKIASSVSSSRKITRKNEMKSKHNIEDIIKLFQESDAITTVFVAADLSKLPPITFDSIDVSNLLNGISSIKADLEGLKDTMTKHNTVAQTLADSAATIDRRVASLELQQKPADVTPHATRVLDNNRNTMPAVTKQNSYADTLVNNFKKPDTTWQQINRKRNNKPTGLIGASTTSTIRTIKKVPRPRTANVFATRFDPDTTEEEVKTHLVDVLKIEVNVEQCKSKYDTYTSFHITAQCEDPSVFMNPDIWPEDTYVRWWRTPRQPSRQHDDADS